MNRGHDRFELISVGTDRFTCLGESLPIDAFGDLAIEILTPELVVVPAKLAAPPQRAGSEPAPPLVLGQHLPRQLCHGSDAATGPLQGASRRFKSGLDSHFGIATVGAFPTDGSPDVRTDPKGFNRLAIRLHRYANPMLPSCCLFNQGNSVSTTSRSGYRSCN